MHPDRRRIAELAIANKLKGVRYTDTAEQLGVSITVVNNALRDYRALETATTLVSTNTQYDGDGNVLKRWVKEAHTPDKQAALLEALSALPETVLPRAEHPLEPISTKDRLTVYVLSDAHIGVQAHDVRNSAYGMAEDVCQALDTLIARLAPSGDALLVNLGDFTHADNWQALTPASGNTLQVSDSYAVAVRYALQLAVYSIDRLLEHHKRVRVWWLAGNHDPATSAVIFEALKLYYSASERVWFEPAQQTAYMVYRQNLLAATHGDKVKLDKLPMQMATDWPLAWGETTNRVWLTGHVHHNQTKELTGCTVHSFRTLAPRDRWHHEQGYRAAREMVALVYGRAGEIERHTVNIEHLGGE